MNIAMSAKGAVVVDILEAVVLGCFERHSQGVRMLDLRLSGVTIVTTLMSILGLEAQMWGIEVEDTATEVVDIRGFVQQVSTSIQRNPILLAVGAKYMDLNATFPAARGPAGFTHLSEEGREEIRLAVIHSFVMHAVTTALFYEKNGGPLWKALMSDLQQRRDSVPWMDGCVQNLSLIHI